MANQTKILFPLGIATGAAHCNRQIERDALEDHILSGTHTWIWSRRRMGKTSLLEQVLIDVPRNSRSFVATKKLDLNLVHDGESLEHAIREAVGALTVQIREENNLSEAWLLSLFQSFKPELTLGAFGQKLKLTPLASPQDTITEALLKLEEAAKHTNNKAIFAIDEFQQLSQLTYGKADHSLEGAIRHAVERSANVAYIFAGSERHLLEEMFENRDRPLFNLCRKLTLKRIGASHYRTHLNTNAKARWDRELTEEQISHIFELTERHPQWLNGLCSILWRESTPPSEDSIRAAWNDLYTEQLSVVQGTVTSLSATQRALLVGIALAGTVQHPTSRPFLESIRLASSTGNSAKEMLTRQDLIEQNEDNHWRVVNPLMAKYLRDTNNQ